MQAAACLFFYDSFLEPTLFEQQTMCHGNRQAPVG
jgi:hypothetical protein